MRKILCFILVLLFLLPVFGLAEREYSFDAWPDIWEVQANDGMFADVVQVDLYTRMIFSKSELGVYISTPYEVKYIQDVLLTDGKTICHASIQEIEYTEMYVTFPCETIREFTRYKGLYMIFLWKIPED